MNIEAIMAEARKAGEQQTFRYRFSSAGDPCVRALVYDAIDADDGASPAVAPRRLRDQLAMACGTAVGEVLEAAARRLGMLTQQPHNFDTGAVRVSGQSDVTDRQVVLDIKLVGEKSWQRAPLPKHVLQVNGYAVASDAPGWALLYVRGSTIFDEDSPEVEWKAFTGDASVEKAQELCATWEQVDRYRRLRELPERVFGASPEKFPCGWCRHLARCALPEEP